MKYSINKYRNPPPPEPHPLLAPIRRPAWTPVGTGRFPMQDISPLFSNWLREGITLSSPNIMPISNLKRGVTRRVGGRLEFLRPLVQTSFCGEVGFGIWLNHHRQIWKLTWCTAADLNNGLVPMDHLVIGWLWLPLKTIAIQSSPREVSSEPLTNFTIVQVCLI